MRLHILLITAFLHLAILGDALQNYTKDQYIALNSAIRKVANQMKARKLAA